MSEVNDSENNHAKNSTPSIGDLNVNNVNIDLTPKETTTNTNITVLDQTKHSVSAIINIGPQKNEGDGKEKAIRGEEVKSIIDKLKIEDFPPGRFQHAINLFREALSCYENGDYMASTIMCRASTESMLFLCIAEIEKSPDGKNFKVKLDNVRRNKKGGIMYYKYSDNLKKAKNRGYLDDDVYKWLSEDLDENDKYKGIIRHSGDLVAHYSEKLIDDIDAKKSVVNLWIDRQKAWEIIDKTCITLKSINKNYKNKNEL